MLRTPGMNSAFTSVQSLAQTSRCLTLVHVQNVTWNEFKGVQSRLLQRLPSSSNKDSHMPSLTVTGETSHWIKPACDCLGMLTSRKRESVITQTHAHGIPGMK